MTLSPASLPLRFTLPRNTRPPSSSQCSTPCLVSVLRGVAVCRILDAEFREPFVSGSRLFAAAGETPLAGLFRFRLQPGDWDINLAGLAPFDDLWISLTSARHLADSLGFHDELQGLLDWKSRFAWTVADAEENALRHNWRLPPNTLAEERYSTSAMLETPFSAVVMLPKGQDIRTHIPGAPATDGSEGPSWEDQWSLLVRWSVLLYEEYLDKEPDSEFAGNAGSTGPPMDPSLVENSERHLTDLLPSFLWSVLGNQLQLVDPTRLPSLFDKGRAWTFAGGHLVSHKGDGDLVAQMALCDALAQLNLSGWQRLLREQQKLVLPEPPPAEPDLPPLATAFNNLQERFVELEQRLTAEQASFREQLDEAKRVSPGEAGVDRLAIELLAQLRKQEPPRPMPRRFPEIYWAVAVSLVAVAVWLLRLLPITYCTPLPAPPT